MKNRLWTKNFTLLFSASALGAAGGIAGSFALSFLVFDETGSTLASALILAVQMLPAFVIPTFFAPWMDRFPRKPFLVAGDLIGGILYAAAGIYQLPHPFSYDWIGTAGILIGQGILAMIAAAVESRLEIVEESRSEERYTPALWLQDLKEGIAYLRKEKGLLGLYSYLSATNGVARGYGPLLIAFFRTMPGMTSFMYAMFSAAEFSGRTIGGWFCYHVEISKKKKFGFAFLVYQIYETMDLILLWLPYPLMLINRGICGFLGINSATMREAAVQKYIPDKLRARINSLQSVIILAIGSIFSLAAGALGEILDLRLCMALCAGFSIAVCCRILHCSLLGIRMAPPQGDLPDLRSVTSAKTPRRHPKRIPTGCFFQKMMQLKFSAAVNRLAAYQRHSNLNVIVKKNEVSVPAFRNTAEGIRLAKDAGGSFRHHHDGIRQRRASQLHHIPNQTVGGGNTACKGGEVGHFGNAVFNNDTLAIFEAAENAFAFRHTGAAHGIR